MLFAIYSEKAIAEQDLHEILHIGDFSKIIGVGLQDLSDNFRGRNYQYFSVEKI
jgi:hypothetical protein